MDIDRDDDKDDKDKGKQEGEKTSRDTAGTNNREDHGIRI